MDQITEKSTKDLKLKDFPTRNAYMKEYHYRRAASTVAYRRGRYNTKESAVEKENINPNE